MSGERGLTGVIIPVPAADPVLDLVSTKYEGVVRDGVPAHVTVLYPFVDADRIDDEVIAYLAGLFASYPPLDIEFSRFGRSPTLLYLAPEPPEVFQLLTTAVTGRWPEVLPYRGAYGDPIPHLTVAMDADGDIMDEIEGELAKHLPLRTRLGEGWLVVHDRQHWNLRERFPFASR